MEKGDYIVSKTDTGIITKINKNNCYPLYVEFLSGKSMWITGCGFRIVPKKCYLRGDWMTLGQEIRAVRERRKLRQEDVAKEIGIDRAFISKIEANLKIPSPETYLKLDFVLGLGGVIAKHYAKIKLGRGFEKLLIIYEKCAISCPKCSNKILM